MNYKKQKIPTKIAICPSQQSFVVLSTCSSISSADFTGKNSFQTPSTYLNDVAVKLLLQGEGFSSDIPPLSLSQKRRKKPLAGLGRG
jgi:hypothetical protein